MHKLINNKVINIQSNVINRVRSQSPSKNIANFVERNATPTKTKINNLTSTSFLKPNQNKIVGSATNNASFGLTFSKSKQFYKATKNQSQIYQKNKLLNCQKSLIADKEAKLLSSTSSKFSKNNVLAVNKNTGKQFSFQKYSEIQNQKKIDSLRNNIAEYIPKYFQKIQFQDLKRGLVYSQGVILAYEIINSLNQFIPVLGTAKNSQEIISILNSTNNRLDETVNWLSHLQDKDEKMKQQQQPQPVIIQDELEMLNSTVGKTRKDLFNQIYQSQAVTIKQNQQILEYFLKKGNKGSAKSFQTVIDDTDDDAYDRIEIGKTISLIQELKNDINQIKGFFDGGNSTCTYNPPPSQIQEAQVQKTVQSTSDEQKQKQKDEQEQLDAKQRQREQEKKEWQQKRELREKQEQIEKREYEEKLQNQEKELQEQQSRLKAHQQDLAQLWDAKFKDLETELQFTKQQVLKEIANSTELYQSKLQIQSKVSENAMQSIRNLEQTIDKIQAVSDVSRFEKLVNTKFDNQTKDIEKLQHDQDYLQHKVDVLKDELEAVKGKKACNIF